MVIKAPMTQYIYNRYFSEYFVNVLFSVLSVGPYIGKNCGTCNDFLFRSTEKKFQERLF